jgi:hypothetical protein
MDPRLARRWEHWETHLAASHNRGPQSLWREILRRWHWHALLLQQGYLAAAPFRWAVQRLLLLLQLLLALSL